MSFSGLTEALTLQPASQIHDEIRDALAETERLTNLDPDRLIELDVASHRAAVNVLLLRASELVRETALRELGLPNRPPKNLRQRSRSHRR